MSQEYYQDRVLKDVFHRTVIVRKPISGIVSGYHMLPYILIAPDDKNPAHSREIQGTINVSPRFIMSPYQIHDTFGDVFDPETFEKDIQGRIFSFLYSRKGNISLENQNLTIHLFEEPVQERIDKVHDQLLMQENVKTGLIHGPKFPYYPVSIDRFISEILDREFKVG